MSSHRTFARWSRFSCSSHLKVGARCGRHPGRITCGSRSGLQVVDCSVHHLAGHGTDFSDEGALQLFGLSLACLYRPDLWDSPKRRSRADSGLASAAPTQPPSFRLMTLPGKLLLEPLTEPGAWSLNPVWTGGAGPFRRIVFLNVTSVVRDSEPGARTDLSELFTCSDRSACMDGLHGLGLCQSLQSCPASCGIACHL